jgi:hypothetical protein
VFSHGGVHDAPAVMSEDHQHEQQSARCCRHHEEIRRHDLVDVIGQKRVPRLRDGGRRLAMYFATVA